jgi:hypothetical protein
MKSYRNIFFLLLLVALTSNVTAQDSLNFKGQLSLWSNYNPAGNLDLWFGGSYIPQMNYNIRLPDNKLIDFEVSAKLSASAGMNPFDTINASALLKPYRGWIRYSTSNFELRLGLQKINFGSASILRPLMWFDQLDPRDPLQLTDGVWALLCRYYFLNNANLWIWGLYGNKKPRGWEMAGTNKKYPEFGGRVQYPVSKGEVALSYHHRVDDTRGLDTSITAYPKIAENRVGIDGKWDLGIGLWFEGSWTGKGKNLGKYTNNEIVNIGADYTFGLGNGINIIVEQLISSYDEKAFSFSNVLSFTGLSASYPVGLFNNISAIVFYDWGNNSLYNFINWRRQLDKFSLYLMAYWNPENYRMPQFGTKEVLFAGKGIQIMLAINH